MRVREIIGDNGIIAQVYNIGGMADRSFPTPENFPLQFGFRSSREPWVSPGHMHKPVNRSIIGTAEFIFVMKGELDVTFYDENEKVLDKIILTDQMAFLQIKGGHLLKFGSNTTYFELKQGPYLGKDFDKYLL